MGTARVGMPPLRNPHNCQTIIMENQGNDRFKIVTPLERYD
jgi:hypothetical protein